MTPRRTPSIPPPPVRDTAPSVVRDAVPPAAPSSTRPRVEPPPPARSTSNPVPEPQDAALEWLDAQLAEDLVLDDLAVSMIAVADDEAMHPIGDDERTPPRPSRVPR